MNDTKVSCDFCNKESIGYVSRQLQGPFYCEDHQSKAEEETEEYLQYLDSVQLINSDEGFK